MISSTSSSHLLCKEHEEKLLFYCEEDRIPICSICICKDGKHKSHEYELLNKKVDKTKNEIKNMMEHSKVILFLFLILIIIFIFYL